MSSNESRSDRPAGTDHVRQRRGGLGRGLDALIPDVPQPVTPATPAEVPIGSIIPNPFQPRSRMDEDALALLAESIGTHGVIQPLVVRANEEPGSWVLIAGERRWRAAQRAGLQQVPVVVLDAAPQAMLEIALVENVVRADLSPIEEALAYRQLIEEFGLTQATVASRVGRSRVSVTNTLRLLGAPAGVQEAVQSGEISEGHARALLGLPSGADQLALLEVIIERSLTVRQTEEAVRRWNARTSNGRGKAGSSAPPPHLASLTTRLERAAGAPVTLRTRSTGSGSIEIGFASEEELARIVEALTGSDLF